MADLTLLTIPQNRFFSKLEVIFIFLDAGTIYFTAGTRLPHPYNDYNIFLKKQDLFSVWHAGPIWRTLINKAS
jgi:hypothetical protein